MADKSNWPNKRGKVSWFRKDLRVSLGRSWDLKHGRGWFCRVETYKFFKEPLNDMVPFPNQKGAFDGFGFHKNKFTAVRIALREIGYEMKPLGDEVLHFMRNDKRFKNLHTSERHWAILDDQGLEIGRMWFKNMLGGWRLQTVDDPYNMWKERGPINNREKLISELNAIIK